MSVRSEWLLPADLLISRMMKQNNRDSSHTSRICQYYEQHRRQIMRIRYSIDLTGMQRIQKNNETNFSLLAGN